MPRKQKNLIVVLSDIHIGTNAPTVWYQQSIHEFHLTSVLDYVINNAQWIQELILLGDVVDFWTYPHDQIPPSFDDIMAANPNIFGANGKLSQVLTQLNGKVTYVRGNHDMTITQNDLDKIQNPQGYKIKLSPGDTYFPLGDDRKIVCTHGHLYTMFNKPYESATNPIAPLPLGYFITRTVASMRSRELQPGQTVAKLRDSGDPSSLEILSGAGDAIWDGLPDDTSLKLLKLIFEPNITNFFEVIEKLSQKSWNSFSSVASTLLDVITKITGVGENEPIKLVNGNTITIAQAKNSYKNLFSEWQEKENSFVTAYKSARSELDTTYMAWFAQRLALEVGAELVVMGHTHKPISRLSQSLIKYVNTGFNCPSEPDIGKKHPTFIEINIEKCEAEVRQVVKNGSSCSIEISHPQVDSVIDKNTPGDFSCYVIIDNQQGDYDLSLEEYGVEEGVYVVNPPHKIGRETARFWLQDKTGFYGAKGWVKYSYISNKGIRKEMMFRFGCPYIGLGSTGDNYCYGGNFYTKSGDSVWSNKNEVKTSGHPFFVKFVL